jgi:mono/diheme cytochrome c family protein
VAAAIVAMALLTLPCSAAGPALAANGGDAKIEYNRDIRPILSENCFACHGPDDAKRKGKFRLDLRESAIAKKAIVPGKPADSTLVDRIQTNDPDDAMPPPESHKTLTATQKDVLKRWVAQGAEYKPHWAFIAPVRPPVPQVRTSGWVRNPIDAFVLGRLESQQITPSPQADKRTLLRRVCLDLTGLPPTPAEVQAFVADPAPDAYERQVDRLLASPHFGERWAKHWLDQARYADSNGYSIDAPRSIWKYRDWVIDAINRDMPFDRFTIEQLAGDLLPNPTTDQLIATGFHRNTQINQEGGIDPEQFRVESVIDRVGTTGTVWLGLTIACAQCHNHKFDPISQKEYYQFLAFFNNQDEPTLALGAAGSGAAPDALEEKILEVEKTLQQTDAQTNANRKKLQGELAKLKKQAASLGDSTMVLAERKDPRETHVLIKGDFTRPADLVTPGVPAVLPPIAFADPAKPTRLDLARWLVSPANPLTARVTVNRIWAEYFGRGIVETDNDFGSQGAAPANPELLDWLATELVAHNWSIKALHRLIVTSATYRQASVVRPDLQQADPYNTLLARQTRVRLDAEIVRDVALEASGLLTDKIGGPSVYPPQPEGVMGLGQVKRDWITSTGPDRYRRGMYTFLWRTTPHPLLTAFDAPDGTSACTRRLRSNTPLQGLILLNDEAFVEFARALALRVMTESLGDDAARIDHAFCLCAARTPDADERQVLLRLLDKQRHAFAADEQDARTFAGGKWPPGASADEFAAWTIVCRAMLNLDETITRE